MRSPPQLIADVLRIVADRKFSVGEAQLWIGNPSLAMAMFERANVDAALKIRNR